MIGKMKAEFFKIFTVRSTYIMLVISLLIEFFYAFYIQGYRTAGNITDSYQLYTSVTGSLTTLSFLFILISALSVTHEYRHGTIVYTLSMSNNRFKVLLAKFAVLTGFAIAVALIFGALGPLLTYWGVHAKGFYLNDQTFPFWDLLWRSLFYCWGTVLFGMIIALLLRSQVGTIVTILVFPGTAETLLGFMLKNNIQYLPFTALNGVLSTSSVPSLTNGKASIIVLVYIIVFGALATWLFRRRDAGQ